MKKILFVLIIVISMLSFGEIFINTNYSMTLSATSEIIDNSLNYSEKVDYMGARISYLFPTEDTDEIFFGPYLGVFYNDFKDTSFLKVQNPDIKDISYSLGLNIRYKGKLYDFINFDIFAYGGTHTEDNFNSFATEVIVGAGLNISMIYVNAGYETKYYKIKDNTATKYITVNYLPIYLGVGLDF